VASPLDLDRRLSRKIEGRKTIQLSPADLDMLVASGAIATFRAFVTEKQETEARERLQAAVRSDPSEPT
jgi:hypothetical protein